MRSSPITVSWLIAIVGCSGPPAPDQGSSARVDRSWASGAATYVGRQACAECHGEEVALWSGSHHDLAMQPATPETVLGDFDDRSFTHAGVTTTFFRRGDELWTRTDGESGELIELPIAYTFGVEPLQQYLVETARGRLQALPIAWDSRSRADGGQRWFHLYADEEIDHRDPLHWTGRYFTWNSQCADCHSTAVARGYDPASDRYATTFQEIDVSCEACHGPASNHLLWARSGDRQAAAEDHLRGFSAILSDRDGGEWRFEAAAENDGGSPATASRTVARANRREVETCAPCHSRRSKIHPSYEPGEPLLDAYRPALLTEPLYHPDGQILDEVYVYGSFLQSRMHQRGVTCKDCHDPHSLRLREPGNDLCAKCHLPAVYATREHHRHSPDSAGAHCVDCHLPAKSFMVVDPRRDHSFRVPRPDLTLSLGTPNACNDCHQDRDPEWAPAAVAEWFPGGRSGSRHYGEALSAARARMPDAEARLRQTALDRELPALVRATALFELARFLSPASLDAVESGLGDGDPQVRMAALTALEGADPATGVRLALQLLDDGIRAVRLEAARISSSAPTSLLGNEDRARVELALEEYRQALSVQADQPESHLELGSLLAARGDLAGAREAFEIARRLDPRSPAVALQLSDLARRTGDDLASTSVLRNALQVSPGEAALHHALGLALVREGMKQEALASLRRAAELEPNEPRYGYVYGVALWDLEERREALATLDENHRRHPADRETLSALVAYHQTAGNDRQALRYARRLLELVPENRQLQALVRELAR